MQQKARFIFLFVGMLDRFCERGGWIGERKRDFVPFAPVAGYIGLFWVDFDEWVYIVMFVEDERYRGLCDCVTVMRMHNFNNDWVHLMTLRLRSMRHLLLPCYAIPPTGLQLPSMESTVVCTLSPPIPLQRAPPRKILHTPPHLSLTYCQCRVLSEERLQLKRETHDWPGCP